MTSERYGVETPDVKEAGVHPGTGEAASPPGRAQRIDARGNRRRILEAAEEVFGSRGASASTEDVAAQAGVGIATVFRHFPTKAVLLQAVVVRHFEVLSEHAEHQLEAADAGAGFFELFTHVVADAGTKIAILDALQDAGGDVESGPAKASQAFRRAFGRLLERAQHAGAVRSDVELPEVYALLVGASRAAAAGPAPQAVRDAMLRIVFDGLRGGPAAPLTRGSAGARSLS